MTVLYISDFDLKGSGYCNIGIGLCTELSKNYDVIALGLGYNRQEHNYPFKIIPTQVNELAQMVNNLKAKLDIEAIIVALDIPLQERLLAQLNAPNDIPYLGIFPLEAGPLCGPWAVSLLRMDKRLIMSKFGQKELENVGVTSDYIPVGFDKEAWRPPTTEERQMLRDGLGIGKNTKVILTVADNQERKNLSRAIEIFADWVYGFEVGRGQKFTQEQKGLRKDAVYWLVTRPKSPVGWKMEDYAQDYGVLDRLNIWERGISFKQLWSLYAAADVFLLTSKAEGLAMPILEAMSCRLPTIGTDCAAIAEHVADGRGLGIKPDYVMVDPWGNSNRYMAGREDGVYKMQLYFNGMQDLDRVQMLNKAQEYANEREWSTAGNVLIEAIEDVKKMKGA